MKLLPGIALIIVGFFLPLTISAAADTFTISVGKVNSPADQNSFHLTFVAKDLTVNPSRNITVKCLKQGPFDPGFSQYGLDIELIPGGNVDFCDITSDIVNSGGNYQFKVIASVREPAVEEHISDTVIVEYTGPVNTGTATTSANSGDLATTVTGSPTPEILGASSDTKWTFKKWIVLLVIAFVIYFVLNFVKRAKSK